MNKLFFVLLIIISSVNSASINFSDRMMSRLSEIQSPLSQELKIKKASITLTTDNVDIDLKANKMMAFGKNEIISEYGNIVSDKITIDYADLKIGLFGNVKLNTQEMSLNSEEAYVKVNENTFIATKAVKFEHGIYKSSSDSAIFNRNKNEIRFENDVLFTSGNEYAKGDVIIFDLTNETFLSKGKAKIKVSRDVIQ